jgi:uncharacterized membrane protein YkoI
MKRVFIMGVALSVLALAVAGFAQEKAGKSKVELPAVVANAVKANCPGAEIGSIDLEKEAGITLYDIEFKAGKGEIEVAADGTVMDIATIIAMKDVPKAAAEAIQKAAPGATVKQIERSEVRAEIKKEGEKGMLVKLASPRYIYEADLVQGGQEAEVQVAPDGKVVEAPKWKAVMAKKKEEGEEKEEAEEKREKEEAKPAAVDLKILPPAVLNAFKTAYPHAVIKGTSKETEKGVTYYEVESVDGKMNRDLLYTADGKAAEIEETVSPESLPAAVQQTLAREFPGSKILKAEAMTKDGQKLFELRIQVNDKKKGVTIDPAGKIIQ